MEGAEGVKISFIIIFFNVEGLMVCLCANGNISIEREEMNAARERQGRIVVVEQMKGDGS